MKKKIKIAFFGDSVCFGQGISIHKGWVTQLSSYLEELGEKNNVYISVENKSINGNTTRLALERMPYDIQNHNYNIIIIQFGMNDCNYWQSDKGLPRVSPQAFEANLNEIINRGINFGAKYIFINTNHPTVKNKIISKTNISYQESNKKYNEIIRKVTEKRKEVRLNDVETYILKYLKKNKLRISDTIMDDGLHLNIKGHIIYFNYIKPILRKCIENYLKRP